MSKQIIRFPAPGCVVEFMQGGRSVQAWVQGEQGGSLRLYTINKRETKLQASRLLPWSGPQYSPGASRSEIEERLESARAKREEIAAALDLSQLWELAQGEVRQAELGWFAELVWPEPDIDQVAALGQAMLAQKTHFKFSQPYFEIFTAEEVQEREEKQSKAEHAGEIIAIGGEFFRHLLEASRGSGCGRAQIDEKDLPSLEMREELKDILMSRVIDPDAHDADNIWKLLTKNLSAKNMADDPHLPVRLGIAWGVMPEHYNFLLDRIGYESGEDWVADGAEFVDALISALPDKGASLPALGEGKDFISIDPDTTQDFDDAFYLEETSEGYNLSLAIACPAFLWPFESAFDKQVLRRCSSLYLPEGNNFMLPRQLCLEGYSLQAGKERASLLFQVRLDKDLKVLEAKPEFGRLAVTANLTLAQSEEALNGSAGLEAAPYADMLCKALGLAKALRQKRIEHGAVITERLDPEIHLLEKDGEIQVEIVSGTNYELSQLLVGELMILYNSAMADWAVEREIPLIFRTQAATLPKDSAGVWTNPAEIHRVLRGAPPAKSSVDARPHAGVGVAAYTSLTAPMRRYPDLLNQAQIYSYLCNGSPRLDKDALDALLPLILARQDAVGQVQRFRTRYWKLLFLQQQEQQQKGLRYWESIVTDDNNAFVTVVERLTGLVLRGPRHLFGDKLEVGSTVGVRLGKISALRNEIQIMEVVDY